MVTLKKIFISAVIAVGLMGGLTQASFLADFDYNVLTPLIERSKEAVNAVATSLSATKTVCTDTKAFTKNLYDQQKNALKLIKAELKKAYQAAKRNGKSVWFSDKQIYKAYKKLVYKHWKKTRRFPTV